jgi:hypothetical protein
MSFLIRGDNVVFKNSHGDGNTINLKHGNSNNALNFQSDIKIQTNNKLNLGSVYMVQDGNNLVWKKTSDDSVMMTLEA